MPRTLHTRLLAVASVAAIPFAFAFLAEPAAPETAASPASIDRTASNQPLSWAQLNQHRHTLRSPSAATPLATTAALTPAQAGADPFFVEPRVPRAAGTPCVDEVVRDVIFEESVSEYQFSWTPSGACTGPWSKIVLVVETTGPSELSAAAMRVHFNTINGGAGPHPGGGVLFLGAPHHHDLVGIWHLERDVTEYAKALHYGMQIGYGTAVKDNFYWDFGPLDTTATVKLVYYPASSATPEQRTADEMRSLHTDEYTGGAGWMFEDLPRNIERVYLDVMARPLGSRVWYSCVPTEALSTWPQLNSRFGMGDYRPYAVALHQGCSADNGSYREIEVSIDGQLAGLAPAFPSLPLSVGFNIGHPAPSVQALNILPFRVDLTPFAALLNDGQPHSIVARLVNNSESGAVVTGQLLLYLDESRSVVTGALTRNTLAGQPSVANVAHTLALNGQTLAGDITTYLRREYTIEGYVDTSQGRIHSSVYQVSRFANKQTLRVVGPDDSTLPRGENYEQDYMQNIRLSNTADRVSRRVRGTTLLSEDKDYTSYPLTLNYAAGGQVLWFDDLPYASTDYQDLDVHHARGMRASHFRRGGARYDTSLADVFDAHGKFDRVTQTTPEVFERWSKRRYLFTDNRGSCYSAGLTTADGELQTRTRGTECPNGNGIRWYAHPDGAPEAMLWTANP
jgi:hypothetical protein